VKIAKSLLRNIRGLFLIRGIHFQSTLADLAHPAGVTEHAFEKPGDKS
jgi:hypothetical protein